MTFHPVCLGPGIKISTLISSQAIEQDVQYFPTTDVKCYLHAEYL